MAMYHSQSGAGDLHLSALVFECCGHSGIPVLSVRFALVVRVRFIIFGVLRFAR